MADTIANFIPVPKPSSDAYRPERPLERNALVQAQVKHFHAVEKDLPAELQSGIDVTSIKTEGEASKYIRRVTEAIHKHGGAGKVQRAR